MDQTLGLRLPGVTDPPRKIIAYVSWYKNIFYQCSLLNPMRSLSTEANHLDFTKPSSCLLLWCNYLLEAASLRHNRNSNHSRCMLYSSDGEPLWTECLNSNPNVTKGIPKYQRGDSWMGQMRSYVRKNILCIKVFCLKRSTQWQSFQWYTQIFIER